jgi:hypothetical protein
VDDETQVGGHHLTASLFVAGSDSLSQHRLSIVVGQRMMIEVSKEQAEAVGI